MEVLELKPLKNKKLKLILVESEFSIDWWFQPSAQKKHNLVWNLHLISKEYLNLIENLINKYKPNFAVEEKGSRREDTISPDDPIATLLKKYNIPYKMVDISENAEGYLSLNLEEHRTLIKNLTDIISNFKNSNTKISLENNFDYQRIILWREYLQREYKEQEQEIRYKVREAWMMMRILKLAKEMEENKLKALFICDPSHFKGITELAKELGVETEQIKIKRVAKVLNNPVSDSIKTIIGKSILELTPINVKKKEALEKICYFFDTDDNASPFDINMAYDAGFDVVVPISKMTADQVPKLVQDAIFSRKPKAPTTFFIGGSNVKEGDKIAKKVLESLVPPFECPVIIDPRGAHTTAASIVVKTMEIASQRGMEQLEGKNIVILGTGPVGRIAAILGANLKAQITLVETWDKSSMEILKDIIENLNKETDDNATQIKGFFASTDERKYEIIKNADIIWSLAAAGIEILSSNIMSKLSGKKLVVDINLVPPYGVKGLKPKDNNKEIFPGIFGIGALALGHLKSTTEAVILKEAAITRGKKVFNYKYAFDVAKKLLFGKNIQVSY